MKGEGALIASREKPYERSLACRFSEAVSVDSFKADRIATVVSTELLFAIVGDVELQGSALLDVLLCCLIPSVFGGISAITQPNDDNGKFLICYLGDFYTDLAAILPGAGLVADDFLRGDFNSRLMQVL